MNDIVPAITEKPWTKYHGPFLLRAITSENIAHCLLWQFAQENMQLTR